MFFTCGNGARSATAAFLRAYLGGGCRQRVLSIPLERQSRRAAFTAALRRDLQGLHFEALRRVRVLLNSQTRRSDPQSTTDDCGPAHFSRLYAGGCKKVLMKESKPPLDKSSSFKTRT